MSESIKYYVNPAKRIVAATVTVEPDAIIEEIMSLFRKSFSDSLVITGCTYNVKSFSLKGKYVGVATCHPDDTFDIEKGKKIARRKALKAYMNDRMAITNKVLNAANSFAQRAECMHSHSISAIKNINKSLNKSN